MTKNAFLAQLEQSLKGLPQQDIADTLAFYGEMIDDRTEEGLSEEEAVASVGSIEKIVSQVTGDPAISKVSINKTQSKRKLTAWEILLLILGAPLWIALLAVAFAVVVSVVASLWAGIISLWAGFASMAGSAFGCTLGGIILAFVGKGMESIAALSAGLVCGGLGIFLFFGCKWVTEKSGILTKKLFLWIKHIFTGTGRKNHE